MFVRRQTLVALLLLAVSVTGCAGSGGAPVAAPEPAPAAPATPAPEPAAPATPPAAEPEPEPSPVSSTVTVVDEPWLTAPARVFTLARQVKLAFSAPVDQASVEATLKERLKSFPYKLAWPSDRDLLLTPGQGCAYFEIGAAGAKDAQGRTLEPDHNPLLKLKLPCHGGGQILRGLPDGKEYPGFSESGGMMDTHPASGRLLGINGTIYYLVEGEQVRHLAHTTETAWAVFVPDGNVLLSDAQTLRLVAPDGKELKTVTLAGAVLNGILSPDGQEAVLLVKANEQAGFQRLNLAAWTVTEWKALDRPVQRGLLNWVAGRQQIKVLAEQAAPWQFDLTTGQTQEVSGSPLISSPDGRWVVDADIGAIIGADGRSVPVTAAMRATAYPYALWAPDSRHVLFPGGQVIDVESGREVALIEGTSCGPPYLHKLGKVGSDPVAAYSEACI